MRPPRAGKVLCVGRTYCDLLFTGVTSFPASGEEIFADNFAIHPGGGAYITAAYLAAAGVDAALCSVLPGGPLGHQVSQQIDQSGVDLSYCESAPKGGTPQITVAISSKGERSFLTNRSGPALPDSIHRAMDDPDLTHLHIGEIATLADNPDLIQRAQKRALTVSLDCSWDEAWLKNFATPDLIKPVDLFLPSEKELRMLLNFETPLRDNADEIAKLAACVVVKQGAGGATCFSGGTVIRSDAVGADVVDTTGAGDAFNAGFLAAWLYGGTPQDCLRSGNSLGGQAVQNVGGTASVG